MHIHPITAAISGPETANDPDTSSKETLSQSINGSLVRSLTLPAVRLFFQKFPFSLVERLLDSLHERQFLFRLQLLHFFRRKFEQFLETSYVTHFSIITRTSPTYSPLGKQS